MTDLELKLPPQVRSWFHVYFTIRRILFEMSGIQGRVALPDDPVFDMIKNVFDVGGFPSCKRICNEFRVDSTSDFRFHKGENSGLGNVYIWVSRVGAYKTSQNNILVSLNLVMKVEVQVRVVFFNILKIQNQYKYSVTPVSYTLTSAGQARINQSIEAFVYYILGSHVNVRSSIIGSSGSA